MRHLLLPLAIWMGVLQLAPVGQPIVSLASFATLLSAAVALSGLTVMVYRLGVWRQEMHNTKHSISAEVTRYREESIRQFEELRRRLTAVETRLRRLGRRAS